MKTTNEKIKIFAQQLQKEIETKIEKLNKCFDEDKDIIENLEFQSFSNNNVWKGETKNKIFFTYSDHYRGNCGYWMSIEELNNPHVNMDDRGYIVGVAVDLNNYRKLSNLLIFPEPIFFCNIPYFRQSKYAENHKLLCKTIYNTAISNLKTVIDNIKNEIDTEIQKKIGFRMIGLIKPIY